MSTSVTPQYLLEGAAYALEQCGLLLRDANSLYRNGSYSSAVALALFAREELGRYQTLLELRKQVLGGDHLTTQEIQACCRHHERKQQAGMLSFVMRVTDTALGGLLGTYLSVKQGSEEWEAAREQLEQTTIPLERHKQRMSALYVDALLNGWNRPISAISQITAHAYLRDAADDYSAHYYNYTLGGADPELEKWIGRPILPVPERPELPPWLTFTIPDQTHEASGR